jgi:hypothetical protein
MAGGDRWLEPFVPAHACPFAEAGYPARRRDDFSGAVGRLNDCPSKMGISRFGHRSAAYRLTG